MLFMTWSATDRDSHLREFCQVVDGLSVPIATYFDAEELDDAIGTIALAATEGSPTEQWRQRAAELTSTLTCNSALRIFKRTRNVVDLESRANIASTIALLQPSVLAAMVEHALESDAHWRTGLRVASKVEVEELATVLAAVITSSAHSDLSGFTETWRGLLSCLFSSRRRMFGGITLRGASPNQEKKLDAEEQWRCGLDILSQLALIIGDRPTTRDALASALQSIGCDSYGGVEPDDLIELCPSLQVCFPV